MANGDAFQQVLSRCGLDKVESDIFVLCWKYTRLSVTGITRHLRMPRSTVHGYVEKLVEKNMLVVTKGTQGNYYSAISPDDLISLIENRKNDYQEVIQQIELIKPTIIAQVHHVDVPKVKYYAGSDSLPIIFEKTLQGADKYFFTDIDAVAAATGWTIKKIAKVFAKNVGFYKEIIVDTSMGRSYVAEKNKIVKKKNYQTKYLSHTIGIRSSNCLIDDVFYHIAYADHIVAVEIADPIYANMYRVLFDHMWEHIS